MLVGADPFHAGAGHAVRAIVTSASPTARGPRQHRAARRQASNQASDGPGSWGVFPRSTPSTPPNVKRGRGDGPVASWGALGDDASGVVARVTFPHAVGPEDGIGRFRRGIRRPKVAAAFQAHPELIGLPGFHGTWICQIHERAAALAAHLKVGISHWLDPSSEPSGGAAEHMPSWTRDLQEPGGPRSIVRLPWLLSPPGAFVLAPRTAPFVLPGLNRSVVGGSRPPSFPRRILDT